jgi:hypothetical protein
MVAADETSTQPDVCTTAFPGSYLAAHPLRLHRRKMTKPLLVTSALLATALVARTAAADPSVTEQAPPRADDRAYVSAGASVGADSAVDWMYAGFGADAGLRLSQHWWLHGAAAAYGRVGYGTVNDVTVMSPSEHVYEGRLGFEARGCHSTGLCYFGGADAGYRVGTSAGESLDGTTVVLRSGLDIGIGSGGLRFRPGVDVHLSGQPANADPAVPLPAFGIGVTTALAYAF